TCNLISRGCGPGVRCVMRTPPGSDLRMPWGRLGRQVESGGRNRIVPRAFLEAGEPGGIVPRAFLEAGEPDGIVPRAFLEAGEPDGIVPRAFPEARSGPCSSGSRSHRT